MDERTTLAPEDINEAHDLIAEQRALGDESFLRVFLVDSDVVGTEAAHIIEHCDAEEHLDDRVVPVMVGILTGIVAERQRQARVAGEGHG